VLSCEGVDFLHQKSIVAAFTAIAIVSLCAHTFVGEIIAVVDALHLLHNILLLLLLTIPVAAAAHATLQTGVCARLVTCGPCTAPRAVGALCRLGLLVISECNGRSKVHRLCRGLLGKRESRWVCVCVCVCMCVCVDWRQQQTMRPQADSCLQ
jgi:hypothetical protein